MINKIFRHLHLWLSIPLCLIVTLMCISGAILLFERDFGHTGQARVEINGSQPLPIDSILISANNYLNGKNHIVGVTTYPDPCHAYKVMLAKPAMAAIWVNQYTGEVIGNYERAQIFKVASSAHRRLFGKSKAEGSYGAKTGKLIIGISSIALLFIIISGLVIWWPHKGHWGEKFSITTKRGSFKFWYDIHCVGGAISSVILLICVFTGLTWSFGWYKSNFYAVFGSEVAKSSIHNVPAENFDRWEIAYESLKLNNEDKEIRLYQGEIDVVLGENGNQQAVDTYNFDTNNGNIISVEKYTHKERSNHIKGWIYTLHVGAWLGWISRILYLVCVIIGSILPITGYYLWINRLCKKKL